MERTPPPPQAKPPPFYRLIRALLLLLVRVFYGLRVSGLEHVPRSGGCVLGANHISAWDPPIVGMALPREVHFMAKRELFSKPVLRNIYHGLRAFPVDRSGNDIGAIKEALRRLQRGHVVGIFFEGTRNRGGDVAAQQGAAFLAQRAGVPLLPAAIWREGRTFCVRFGAPLLAAGRGRHDAEALTEDLVVAVRGLIPTSTHHLPK
jgi:1-acyl-sn-glycerol-3-phosphate acyltransferase